MMKIKKILLVIVTILLIAGCTKKELVKNYDNMKIGKDGINGYMFELRIYGIENKKSVNEILRVTNYNNNEFKIVKMGTFVPIGNPAVGEGEATDVPEKNIDVTENPRSLNNDTITYVKNNKVYTANAEGIYELNDSKNMKYTNPKVYLEGLNNITSLSKGEKQKLGNNEYTFYKATFRKDTINDIIADTNLTKTKATKNVEGEVYIDSNGYVYKIVYKLDNVTFNINYFNINNVSPISFPKEIK